jgi:hypothetical protein
MDPPILNNGGQGGDGPTNNPNNIRVYLDVVGFTSIHMC